MKRKLTLALTLVIGLLVSCAKEDSSDLNTNLDVDIAYISIKVDKQAEPRGSSEIDGTESDIKTLYFITFNNVGNAVGIPGTADYYTVLTSPPDKPGAVKISAKGTKLLLIANPGDKLKTAIQSIDGTSTFTVFNQAIAGARRGEIIEDGSTKGFAMINSGDDSGGGPMTDPLIDITNNLVILEEGMTENDAMNAAKAKELPIQIERLSSKIELLKKAGFTTSPAGAKFDLLGWTLDAVNLTFYPFAEKTMLSSTPTPGTKYNYNFYTKDPNFTGKSGLDYGTIGSDYSPVLVVPYIWMDEDDITYCVENTMAAAEQKFENATRVVIKASYYPVSTWTNDWFSFAGINYENLAALQTAYNDGGINLKAACDDMYDKIKDYTDAESLPLAGANFAALTIGDLSQIENGGEVIKTDKNTPCIRWYQEGLSYYYYEIIHDNDATGNMAFAKYGVVRNNWYKLSLASVSGPGTPWYPDINIPGPGDPDPKDPIDESTAYIAVEVDVMPWIVWAKDIYL